jgi:hypothetical protein
MWWINPERSSYFGLASDAQSESSMTYAADGAGAQLLFVVPAKGLVIVHRGDTDNGRGVDERAALELAAQIVRARTERPGDAPVALTELVPAPLPNAKPAPAEHKAIAFEPGSIAALVGFYVVSPKMTVELFEHEGRLFAFAPGRGELELFAFAKESYFARSTPLEITVERGSGGEVVAINGSLQGNPIRAVKQAAPTDREASAPSGARSE